MLYKFSSQYFFVHTAKKIQSMSKNDDDDNSNTSKNVTQFQVCTVHCKYNNLKYSTIFVGLAMHTTAVFQFKKCICVHQQQHQQRKNVRNTFYTL